MHVSEQSMVSMGFSLAVSVIVPIATSFVVFRRRRVPFKVFAVGAGIWLLFTQILERMVHMFVLGRTGIVHNPFLFAVYGSLAAGLFEEVGRYVAFTRYVPKSRSWHDGIAYGLGHGGMESLFVGVMGNLQLIALSVLINSGGFGKVAEKLPKDAAQSILSLLTGPSYIFLLGGIERILALVIQVCLSLVVLYAVRMRKPLFVIVAILLHAAFDIPAALYQSHVLTLVATELLLAVLTVPAAWFIYRSRDMIEHK